MMKMNLLRTLMLLLLAALLPETSLAQSSETFDFTDWNFTSTGNWSTSYTAHTVTGTSATVDFAGACKQTSTITDCPVTKEGAITVTLTDANITAITGVKFYLKQWNKKAQTITLNTSTDGTTFTATDNTVSFTKSTQGATAELTATDLSAKALKLTLKTSGNQVGIQKIIVAYDGGSLDGGSDPQPEQPVDPTLSFETKTKLLAVGETFTNVLTVPDGLTATYASNNDAVATVTAAGLVTAITAGTATITATTEATDTYTAGTATYTVIVTDESTPVLFYESFNSAPGTGGNDGEFKGSVASNDWAEADMDNAGWTSTGKVYEGLQCIRIGSGKEVGSVTTPSLGLLNGEATLTFNAAGWESTKTVTLTVSITGGGTLSLDGADPADKVTITPAAGAWGMYTVTIAAGTSASQLTFATSGSEKRVFLDEVRLQGELEAIPVAIGATTYATLYYSDRALTIPAGVEATTYTVADGRLAVSKTYTEGAILPKDEAVVLHADEGTYQFMPTATQAVKDADNALLGTDEEVDLTGDADAADYKYYMLTYPQNKPEATGFYYGAADGAAFTNGAHKAYLRIARSAADAKGWAFSDAPTAITDLQPAAPATDAPRYNLAGQRVNKNYRGVVIQNGRKFINK